jgi:hypothetical protein
MGISSPWGKRLLNRILMLARSWLSLLEQRRAAEGLGVWRRRQLSGPVSERRAARSAALFPEQSAEVR